MFFVGWVDYRYMKQSTIDRQTQPIILTVHEGEFRPVVCNLEDALQVQLTRLVLPVERNWRYPGQGPNKPQGKELVKACIVIFQNTQTLLDKGLLKHNTVGNTVRTKKFFTQY